MQSVFRLVQTLPWHDLAALRRDHFFRGLLIADALFVALHLGRAVARHSGLAAGPLDALALDLEGSYAELYQHVKVAAAAALLAYAFFATGARIFAALSLLLTYVALDDSLQFHERTGQWVTEKAWPPLRGLDASGAEALFLAGIGAAAAALLGLTVRSSPVEQVRRAALFAVPLAAFVVFGGAIDLLHAAIGKPFAGANLLFSTIEDGGEMLSMSAACALARAICGAQQRAAAERLNST